MIVFSAVLAVGCLLLMAGGTTKLVRPHTTAKAMGVAPLVVRTGAVAETIIALACLATGSRATSALVAISYAGFAAFVGWALVRDAPLSTCACFGEPDTPPTMLHLVLNIVIAGAAGGAAITGAGQAAQHLGPSTLASAGVVAYLVFLCLTALPRLRVTG